MSIDADSSRTTAGPCSRLTEAGYDGTAPFTGGSGPPATFQGRARAAATAAFVVVPFAGLGVAMWPHHAFADQPGDPHSPYRYGTSLAGQLARRRNPGRDQPQPAHQPEDTTGNGHR